MYKAGQSIARIQESKKFSRLFFKCSKDGNYNALKLNLIKHKLVKIL